MIPLSLLLVVGASVLLVRGLVVSSQMLIWAAFLAILAAGASLVVSVLHRRGQAAVQGPAFLPAGPPGQEPPGAGVVPPFTGTTGLPVAGSPTTEGSTAAGWGSYRGDAAGPADATGPPTETPAAFETPTATEASTATETSTAMEASTATELPTATVGPADEPPPEDIPVGAALRAAQLPDEVIVVDGRPRYHLADCATLAGRDGSSLALSAARRAGFTPCSLCRPDSTLLARSRGDASSE